MDKKGNIATTTIKIKFDPNSLQVALLFGRILFDQEIPCLRLSKFHVSTSFKGTKRS